MQIIINHDIEINKALKCSDNLLIELADKHKDKIKDVVQISRGNNIKEFSFSISGFKINGTLEVNSEKIIIESRLPFAASFFRGVIESTIKEHADEMIRKCKEQV